MDLRLDHFAAANASGAYSHALGGRAHAGVYWTQIDVPAPLGDVMRVANAVSGLRLLAADFTLLCHDCLDPFRTLLESHIVTDSGPPRQFVPREPAM